MKMKLKKLEISIIILSLSIVLFTAGFFVGKACTEHPVYVSEALKSEADPMAEIPEIPAEKATESPAQTEHELLPGSVDLNTASKETLMTLPGIGEVLAQRIIDYREEYGAFLDMYEVTNVDGIGEKIYGQIEPYLTVTRGE